MKEEFTLRCCSVTVIFTDWPHEWYQVTWVFCLLLLKKKVSIQGFPSYIWYASAEIWTSNTSGTFGLQSRNTITISTGKIITMPLYAAFRVILVHKDVIDDTFLHIFSLSRYEPLIKTLHGRNYVTTKVSKWRSSKITHCQTLMKDTTKQQGSTLT